MGSTAILRKAVRTPVLNVVVPYHSIALNRRNFPQIHQNFSAGGIRSSETIENDSEISGDATWDNEGPGASFGFNATDPYIGFPTFSSADALVPDVLPFGPSHSTQSIQGWMYNTNNYTPSDHRPAIVPFAGPLLNTGPPPFNIVDWPYGTTPYNANPSAAWSSVGNNTIGDTSGAQHAAAEGLSIVPFRPFQCPESSVKKHSESLTCGQSFLQHKDLARHLRTVHASESEPVYRCKCGSRCIRKDNHLRHLESCARQPDPSFNAYYSCRCGNLGADKDGHVSHVRNCVHGFRRRGRPPTRPSA